MIIKTQKNSNYSIISNTCARDINISIKAKGLYFYLMTLPETWTIHREEVYKHFKEGRSSLDSAFNELIELGYIIQKRERNKDGSFMPIEYTVLEDKNEINPHMENPKVENSYVKNQQQLSSNELSIDKLNTNNTNTYIDGVNNIPKVNSCKRKYTVKEFVIPTVDDIQKFIDEAIPERNLDALQIFNTYNDNDWYDSRGNKVSNWKTKIRNNWQKRKEDNESSMYPVYPMLCGEEQRKADEAYEREQEEKKKALAEAEIKAEKDFLETQNFINDLIK